MSDTQFQLATYAGGGDDFVALRLDGETYDIHTLHALYLDGGGGMVI